MTISMTAQANPYQSGDFTRSPHQRNRCRSAVAMIKTG
jgi:hypothetical protein